MQDTEKQQAETVEVLVDPPIAEQPELPLEAVEKPADPQPAKEPEGEKAEQDDVEKIKAQLLAVQQAAAQAQAERDRMAAYALQKEREARAAQGNAQLSQYDMITNALGAAEREQEALERAFQEAFETGDGVKAAKIQRQQTELAVRIRDLSEGKSKIEEMAEQQRRQAERPRQTPQQQPQQPVRQASDFQAWLKSQISHLSPPSQEWIMRHPDVMTDPSKRQKLQHIDGAARLAGLQPDTPAYFAMFEEHLGYRQTGSDRRQTASPTSFAAPVSRDAGGALRPNQIRLTAEEAELCKDNGWNPLDYYKEKVRLQQNRR
jgi:hypothetical protein